MLEELAINSKIIMGNMEYGSDLLLELNNICQTKEIFAGKIEGIGAVKCATIGFYDQEKKEYIWNKIHRPMEVLSLKGNISIKDNKPFVHAHIVLGDHNSQVYGGHLGEDTQVFAFEYIIVPLQGDAFVRGFDKKTGLFLWK